MQITDVPGDGESHIAELERRGGHIRSLKSSQWRAHLAGVVPCDGDTPAAAAAAVLAWAAAK